MSTRIGGIAGVLMATCTIENCLVTGAIAGSYQIGGIVGATQYDYGTTKTIRGCVFWGKLVGRNSVTQIRYYGSMIGIINGGSGTIIIEESYCDDAFNTVLLSDGSNLTDASNSYGTNNSTTYNEDTTGVSAKVSKADLVEKGAASCMSLLDFENTWSAPKDNGYLPTLKNVPTPAKDVIQFAGFQKSDDGDAVRFLAVIKDSDLGKYEKVAIRVDVFAAAGEYRTQIIETEYQTVWGAVKAGDEIKTAGELVSGGKYINAHALTGLTGNTSDLVFYVTPVLTANDGRVMIGQTTTVVYPAG